MSALRAGEYLPPADDHYDPSADMKALSNAHKKKGADSSTYLSKERLMELRKVQNERVEVRYLPSSLFLCLLIRNLLGRENEVVRHGH